MISKRNKQWIAGGTITLLLVLVWWVNFYSPARAGIRDAQEKRDIYLGKKQLLEKKIEKLMEKQAENMIHEGEMHDFADLLISGNNIEEVNAVVQQQIQNFFKDNDILLKTYRVLNTGKWMDYDMGRLQFAIITSHRGLSRLLKYLEEMKQLVKIEKLNINYNKGREHSLHVNFSLETLFVNE
ncbi:MAG: GspMb/PilO family protein [Thermodesulfobacteriota bacterium]|nr:GspMb/PilO family protein [Thermodesulfobacteriota bacterium]